MTNSDRSLVPETLLFERKDLSIFSIPDTKTRLNTLQNYFFPRLDSLVTQTLDLIQEIYGVNPYERMNILRTPRHRKNAKENKNNRPFVRIGIGGKRNNNQPLKIKRKDGGAYKHPSGRLYYLIEPNGFFSVYLYLLGPLDPLLNSEVLTIWRDLLIEYYETLNKIFTLNHISHPDAKYFISFTETLSEERIHCLHSLQFFSPIYFLPVSFERGIFDLQMVFVALYPLLHISIDIEKDRPYQLEPMLASYMKWYQDGGATRWWQRHVKDETDEAPTEIELPELDSYRFIRAGLWWEILARDQWTCCSCGRSVKKHGITLHVDHIIPRSKGGTDAQGNLQSLCMKCNLGKSNRDDTDLTRKSLV